MVTSNCPNYCPSCRCRIGGRISGESVAGKFGLDHVSLLVRSIEISTKFYVDVLGFEPMPPNPSYPLIREPPRF
ncbi:MAG: VOC family protein [Lacisediminihabitans sp.]